MMKKLIFKVTEQKITYEKAAYVVTDSQNYITAEFEFSEEWTGVTKTAIFKGTNGTYSVLLTGNACVIPYEVLTSGFSVSVYGVSGNMRITSDSVYINAVKSGYEDGETPSEPTPTVYEEILDKFSEIKQADSERAEQVKQNADGIDGIRSDMADMNNTLNTKVDKVSGKGLSSNDYTDEEKAKLAGLENYTLPSDVVHDSGYVHTDNNYTNEEKAKVNNVPDNTLEEINTLSNVMNSLAGSLDNMKVDKVQGKGLSKNDYTDEEKEKLSGIEENANNYVLPSDVVHDVSYVHTDNNYTTEEKNKLAELNNYDDTDIKADIAKKADKLKSIPHTTVSGNPIAITDALADEQPLEMRVYGCKNLIPYPYANTTKTVNGITFTDNGDGSITVNGTATARATFVFSTDLSSEIDKSKIYTFSTSISATNNSYVMLSIYKDSTYVTEIGLYGSSLSKTVDLSNRDCNRIQCTFFAENGATFDNYTFKPQLELGTAATDYEIGTGIGDLNNGKYEIPIKITGKNMFDISKITKFVSAADYTTVRKNYAYVRADGTITNTIGRAADSMVYHDSKMTLAQGTYTLSADCMFISDNSGLLQARIGVRDMTNSKWLEKTATLKTLNVTERIYCTFTVDSDTEIAINIQGVGTIKNYIMNLKISNIQLERGNAATEYEPYREQTAAAILDTSLSGSEYIDFVSKKRNGETDITVSGNIELFDGVNKITCQTAAAPSKLEVSYYQDINKVLEELKNAILSQGGNV